MGGKSDEPDTPDYAALAKQQGDAERKAAQEITGWNRPTQINPYGRMDWVQEDGNWTQQERWDPRIQTMSDQALGMQGRFMGQIENQGQFQGPETVKYDPNAGDAMSNALYESVMGRTRQEQERERTGIDTQLRQQGLQPGTEAYDRAMKNLMTAQGDVSAQAALQARLAGGQEARADFGARTAAQQNEYGQAMGEYRLPWEMLSSSQGATAGITKPQFQAFSGATGYQPADMMGAGQAGFEADMGKYNADQQKKANTTNAALQGGAMMAASDIRLKEALSFVGTFAGHDWFTWEWNSKAEKLGLRGKGFGVIAQLTHPRNVVQMSNGYLAVDMGRILA